VVQKGPIDALKPGNFPILRGDQFAPVVRSLADRPAEPGRIVRPGAIFPGLDEQLFRHTADIDAGAAPETLLGDTDPGAMTGRDAGAAHAGGSAAYHEKIEIHASGFLRTGRAICGLAVRLASFRGGFDPGLGSSLILGDLAGRPISRQAGIKSL